MQAELAFTVRISLLYVTFPIESPHPFNEQGGFDITFKEGD
jgi:hypothetical protein